MKGRTAWAFLALACGEPALAAGPDPNPQLWSELDVAASWAPDWRLTALAVDRIGEGLPNPTLWGAGVTLDRRFGDLTVTVGDLEAFARSASSGARVDVNLPLAAVSYDWRIGGFLVSDRNRLEDLSGLRGDPWRYRNRISAQHAVAGLGPISSVFANEEIFYDLQAQRWTRSRAEVGFGVAVASTADLRVYYLRQDDRFASPHAINALGVTLAFDLK